MKKVIVTGAAGFVGSYCVEILKDKNYQVFALSRASREEDRDNIKWITADLFNFQELNSIIEEIKGDLLLHLAWITTPGVFYESEENHIWVKSSLNLIENFLLNGGKRVVVAGSCAEYDWNKKKFLEEDSCYPASLYGRSKLHLFNQLRDICAKYNASFAWGRIFNVFGPKEPPEKIISLIVKAAIEKRKIQCLAKDDVRDFIYIKDVANIFVKLLEESFDGIINIATGKGHSIDDIAKMVGQKLNISNFCDFKQKNSKFPEVVGDIKNLHKLKYRFLFDINKGLDETIRWWLDE